MDPIIYHPSLSSLLVDIRPRSRLKERHKILFNGNVNNNSKEDEGQKDDRAKNEGESCTTTVAFNEIALVCCSTGVVCRKELFETYAAATFIHAKFPHTRRIADLAAGHGLLSWFLLVLDLYPAQTDPTQPSPPVHPRNPLPPRTAVCIDRRMPPAADRIAAAMLERFPQLEHRWSYVQADLTAVDPHPSCLLASVHACGNLSDFLIATAIAGHNGTGGVPLAIVPCCHTAKGRKGYRPHALSGTSAEEVEAAVARTQSDCAEDNGGDAKHRAVADVVDGVRCRTLRNAGYDVEEVALPEAFTGRGRLLLATAGAGAATRTGATVTGGPDARSPVRARGGRMPPAPDVRVPLADDRVSIARCRAIGGRERAQTRLREQIPRHFSPALCASLWHTSSDGDGGGPVLTTETLQTFVDRGVGEIGTAADGMRCTVEKVGGVNVQSTTGRRSQLYRFEYGSVEGTDISAAVVSRADAKRVHNLICKKIANEFGDLLR